MKRGERILATVLAAALAAPACTGGESGRAAKPSVTPPRGGTLRVALHRPVDELDPQRIYDTALWELHRCCLLRTLLSYNGRPADEGGAEARPDLAGGSPEISSDGLTWTFRLKEGIRYAPPFDDTEIVAQDVIRALERMASPKVVPSASYNYAFYYSVIEGFDDVRAGLASTISGLEAPDDHTLVVHLNRQAGDLGYRISLPAAAPIPPNPTDPAAPLGVAAGHDDGYGRYLVASGPYMLEGSQDLEFTSPPAEQPPVSGFVPFQSITLVRNPSWDPATDDLRGANVERIEIELPGQADLSSEDAQRISERDGRRVDAGLLDLVFAELPPRDQIERYQATPDLTQRVHTIGFDIIWFLTMNLAVPPFDDIHVRKAVNLALDKAALVAVWNEASFATQWLSKIASHIAPDPVEGNLLTGYDPYATPGHRGDLELARTEMARSRYDHNADGECDDSVCERVLFASPSLGLLPVVRKNLAGIGIDVDASPDAFNRMFDPSARVPLGTFGLQTDYSTALIFFDAFYSQAIGESGSNTAMVGATSDQLKRWGYSITDVPSVDREVEECVALVGSAQMRCWAELDQVVMEKVVPWAPYITGTTVSIVSNRVAAFSFDQFTQLPALDQIAVVGKEDAQAR